MAKNEANDPIQFEITEKIGVLSTNEKTGWTREVNRVSWNGKDAKIDIRDWDPEHQKMSKGITLSDEEAAKLAGFLK